MGFPHMLQFDHLTVIAPTLEEGVSHVRACLGLDVPFGQQHDFMGTHNHLLQLGDSMYLEIVAIDPGGTNPDRKRWFGLDNQEKVRLEWDTGLRLRSWVARTNSIDQVLDGRDEIFGEKVSFPERNPMFDFAIPNDGSLPLEGAAPSIIDRYGKPRSMDNISDLGARLKSFTLEHPDSTRISLLYHEVGIVGAPSVIEAKSLRYHAQIDTPDGLRILT